MPLTLPPISRRRFLASSLAAGAGLALSSSRWLQAAESAERDPGRVILFSDIHIDADPTILSRNVNMTDHLRQAVAESLLLDKQDRRPSMAIVNGDCAHDHGLPEDYQAVLALLKPLRESGLPVHLAMGNHDNRERFYENVTASAMGEPEIQKPLGDRRVLILETPKADWVILDSLLKTKETPGTVGHEQIEWLKNVLDAPQRKDKPVMVMVHHHPQWKEGRSKAETVKSNGLTDTAALMDALLPRKQVKALLFGHTHVWSHTQEQGLHLVNLPAVAYVFNPNQPSAWTDCQLTDTGASFTLHCLNNKDARNGQVAKLDWRS